MKTLEALDEGGPGPKADGKGSEGGALAIKEESK